MYTGKEKGQTAGVNSLLASITLIAFVTFKILHFGFQLVSFLYVAKPIQCLIFDFDGTIADTLQQSFRILNRLAAKHGFRPLKEEEVPMARDMGTSAFIRYLKIPKLRIPRILAEGRHLLHEEIHTVRPIVGFAEVLPQLRKKVPHLGIVTSNSKENVEAFLDRHKIRHFDFISTSPKLKGKAKNLKAALKVFTLDAAEVAYVGDETRDIKAAKKANMVPVAVTWGFNSEKALMGRGPKHIIHHPRELLELLQG